MNLEKLTLRIDREEVYEYYFMRYMHKTENFLFSDYPKVIKELGGHKEQFQTKIYDIWLREFSASKHQNIINKLSKFIESNDFCLDYKHLG
jgi:hypothetical protein